MPARSGSYCSRDRRLATAQGIVRERCGGGEIRSPPSANSFNYLAIAVPITVPILRALLAQRLVKAGCGDDMQRPPGHEVQTAQARAAGVPVRR